eukprot:CAMPEP_0116038364 /NCGR_PEP_ID=MMETSP0321-20121206/22745_1 /TAXON_ID=163516 /ORGANISM="Leptocylindrus danicus var. danicus, Strain B650" /LENGTH=311 /DNA_ID=CAMNT_0003517025 /DNA_START=51 /DNA_END=989 /DNA_ORIENTATION=+
MTTATSTTTTTGIHIGIALMSSMNVTGNKYGYNSNSNNYSYHINYDYTNQVQAAGETFAKYLHHAWGVGDNACPISTTAATAGNNNAGILVLLSVNDHEIYIATGNLVKHYLPDWKVKRIIEEIKPWLRMQSFNEATRLILRESGSYIDSSSGSSSYDGTAATTISTVVGYIIFFACCGLCCSTCCCNWNKCGRQEYHSQWNDSWEHGRHGDTHAHANHGYFGSGWGAGGVGSGPGGWFGPGGGINNYSYSYQNDAQSYDRPPAFNPNSGGTGGTWGADYGTSDGGAGGTWGGDTPSAPPVGGDGGAGGTW